MANTIGSDRNYNNWLNGGTPTSSADKVYDAILKQAKDGSIVLLHDLHGTTVDGAIRAMKKLEKEGYEFVTVTELLSRDGTPPKASTNYYKG